MCPKGSLVRDTALDDKLSNLTSTLVSIERGEGGDGDYSKLEVARTSLIDAISCFKRSRFTLGRTLAEYKVLYKQEQYWSRAEKEIAKALGCNPRTISRIIEESEAAAGLHPFVLEALEQHRTDPGKKKNAPVVEELLRQPIASSPQEAEAAVRSAVAKTAGKQKSKPKPPSGSIDGFTCRIVELFEARFKTLSPEARNPQLLHCIENVLAALHTDLLTLYNSRNQTRTPVVEGIRDIAAA